MRVAARPLLTGAFVALGLTLGLVASLAVPAAVQAQEVTPSVPPPGSLDVDVALLGDSGAAGAVSVRVECAQTALFGTATYDRTQAVSTTDVSTTVTFAAIPPGSDCDVTLPADGSSAGVTAVQEGIATVTPLRIGPNEQATLGGTITYTAVRAGLAVTVRSTGSLATDAGRTDVTVTVDCGRATDPETLTFPGGAGAPTYQTQVVSGLRAGVSCTVDQTAAGTPAGAEVETTGDSATVVVPVGGAATTITNDYESPQRTVTVTWTVDGAGAGAGSQGAAGVRLVCSDGTDQLFSVAEAAPAGPVVLTPTTVEVQRGATCGLLPTATGARVIDGGEDPDSYVAASLGLPTPTTVGDSGLTLAVNALYAAPTTTIPATATVTLDVDVTDPVGQQGPAAFLLTCGTQQTGVVLADGATDGATATLPLVPVDVACNASTVFDGARLGVTPVVTLPAATPHLTVSDAADPAANTVTVGYRTTISTATVDPRVVITGAAASTRGAGELTVDCGTAVARPIGAAASSPVNLDDVTGIVPGATCTLTSTAAGSTATAIADTSWSPVTVAPGAGETARVTVTNSYTAPVGNVVVFHQMRGNATPYRGAVAITVVCNDALSTGTTLSYLAGAARPPAVLSGLPAGTDCTVTQTASGAIDGLTVSTAPPAAQIIEAAAGVTRVARVTNTYTAQLGSVTVAKSVTGAGANLRGDVTVRVVCTSRTGTFTLPAGSSTPSVVTLDGLYPGETCTVSETANGAIDGVVDVATAISPAATLTIGLGTQAGITVTNEYTAVGSSVTTTTTPGSSTVVPTTTIAGSGGGGLPTAGSNVARVLWFAVAAVSLGLAIQITRHRLIPHKR